MKYRRNSGKILKKTKLDELKMESQVGKHKRDLRNIQVNKNLRKNRRK
jgi:hypothetical protein